MRQKLGLNRKKGILENLIGFLELIDVKLKQDSENENECESVYSIVFLFYILDSLDLFTTTNT